MTVSSCSAYQLNGASHAPPRDACAAVTWRRSRQTQTLNKQQQAAQALACNSKALLDSVPFSSQAKMKVLCIVSTLATLAYASPEPAAGHLRAAPAAAVVATAPEHAAAITAVQDNSTLRADNIMAEITILADTQIKLGAPWFDYHDAKGKGGSGCGKNNDKCSCIGVNNAIQMKGTGSSNTMTGLTFACGFSVDGRDCKIYLDMPYWGSANTVTWQCTGYDLVGQTVPSGKVINQKMQIKKST